MSVFVRRTKEMIQLRAVPKHVAPPLLSAVLIPHHSAVTSLPHTNHENDLQSDIDTDRVMVNIDTSILITNPNLNDF
jgi:hypothetical protein